MSEFNRNSYDADVTSFNELFSKHSGDGFGKISSEVANNELTSLALATSCDNLMNEIANAYHYKLIRKDSSMLEYSQKLMSEQTMELLKIAFNQIRRISKQQNVKRLKIHQKKLR